LTFSPYTLQVRGTWYSMQPTLPSKYKTRGWTTFCNVNLWDYTWHCLLPPCLDMLLLSCILAPAQMKYQLST